MRIYNLIKYSEKCSKASSSLWRYYRDERLLPDAGAIDDFSDNSASFNFTQKITGKTEYKGRKDIEIMVPLKYLSPFWMPLIYCEINFILTWSEKYVFSDTNVN